MPTTKKGDCPNCKKGFLSKTEHINAVKYKDSTVQYISVHSECDNCKTIITTEEQIGVNEVSKNTAKREYDETKA